MSAKLSMVIQQHSTISSIDGAQVPREISSKVCHRTTIYLLGTTVDVQFVGITGCLPELNAPGSTYQMRA